MTEGNKTNLIVNYLPQTLTDEEFRSIFLSIGPIQATKIVRDRMTGYSYGFGFVDFVNDADAIKAIEKINGMQIQNKRLKVAFSRNHDDAKNANLYVRNLPRTMEEDGLKQLFCNYGVVVNARILSDQFTGQSKGIGFVLYNTKNDADNAIQNLHNQVPPGGTEKLNVKHAEDNVGKARPPPGSGGQGEGYEYEAAHHSFYGARTPGMSAGRGGYMPSSRGGGYMGTGGYMGGAGYMGNGMNGAGGPMRTPGYGGGARRFNPMSQEGATYMTGGYNEEETEGYTLFVYNIGTDAEERSLWQLFSPYGLIEKVNCVRDFEKDCCKGYGFVTFTHYHEAANAITALNGYKYKQKPLQVKFKS